MASPPPRPRTEKPEDLGFTKQEMTRWLSPSELVSTGLQVVLSGIFGTYADKREMQDSRPAEVRDFSDRPELWFDYVSDLGDGFNPTYALASLLATEKLDLPGPAGGETVPTPRGTLLVMGGDEVYPAAEIDAYRNRMTGPYRAALPYMADDHPTIFALPGNHDWYDGLTAFTRVFCQGRWIGGWQTSQRRSYFALALPHRWWLWGIDIQFDTYIDEPQLEYFRKAGAQLQPGDSVILCSAKPNWVKANEDDPEAYNTLDYFQRQTVEERGAEVRLHLTGDAHHYARYQAEAGGRELITAGGGGAFLSSTHHLPDTLLLPPPKATHTGRKKAPATFGLVTSYPTKDESKKIARRVVTLPRKNPSFVGLVAVIYVLYAWTIQAAVRQPGQTVAEVMHDLSITGVAAGIGRNPLALLITAVLVVGMAGFTKSKSRRKKWTLGLLHAGAHVAAVVGVVRLVDQLLTNVRGLPYMALLLVLVGVVGGLAGSLVMAAYLYLADRFANCNDNELFAAQRLEGWKNFLRLHIDGDGVLTVYPVKVADVPKRWRLRQGGEQDDPWLEPQGARLAPALIESPVRITPAAPPPPPDAAPSAARRRRTKP